MIPAVERALAGAGAEGMTFTELVEASGYPAALVRSTLSRGCFIEKRVTIVSGSVSSQKNDGKLHLARFRMGDPTELLRAGT